MNIISEYLPFLVANRKQQIASKPAKPITKYGNTNAHHVAGAIYICTRLKRG
jgi:hypothetical protein